MHSSSRDQWNAVAEAYDGVAGTDRDIVYSTLRDDLWDVLGDLRGRSVLDLGCGSGWLAALMKEKGALITGIDGSERLLELARARYPSDTWILHDLKSGLPPIDSPDVVVSNMVLMDFDPIEPVVSDLAGQMAIGSSVVITMPHPAFFNYEMAHDERGTYRKVRDYLEFEEWHIATYGGHTHFHRPMSFYTNLFGAHGLLLRQLREPYYKGNIPVFCLMEFIRVAR